MPHWRMGKALASPVSLVVSGLIFAWFAAVVLPAQSALAGVWTPPGAVFDTSLFYTPAQALAKAAAYSSESRLAYIAASWSFDLVWPIVYTAFLLSAWNFSIARIRPGFGRRGLVSCLVLLGPAFDYAENISVTELLSSHPAAPAAAWAASASTTLKWLFVSAGAVGAIVLLSLAAFLALRRPRH